MPVQHQPHLRLQLLPLRRNPNPILHCILCMVHLLLIRVVVIRTDFVLDLRVHVHLWLSKADTDDCRDVPHWPCSTRNLIRSADCTLTGGGVSDRRPVIHSSGLRGGTAVHRLFGHAVLQFLFLCGESAAHDAQPQHTRWYFDVSRTHYVFAVHHYLVQKVCYELRQGGQ